MECGEEVGCEINIFLKKCPASDKQIRLMTEKSGGVFFFKISAILTALKLKCNQANFLDFGN
jgi:hypothetical protein